MALSRGYFYIPPDSENVSEITKSDYEKLLGNFAAFYAEEVYKKLGMPFVVKPEWESPYFAAFAKMEKGWAEISIWGGVARVPGNQVNILTAILCHELGHLIGGVPRQSLPDYEWASAEGQSDFYAANECLPVFLERFPEYKARAIESDASELCQGNQKCEQIAQTGLNLVRFLQQQSYRDFTPVSIASPELPAEELLRNTYPSDQCRLDNFVQAAVCLKDSTELCKAPICWMGSAQN